MDEAVIIKDDLANRKTEGMPVGGRFLRFLNTVRNLERVMKAYEKDLLRRYPALGERLACVIKEAGMNGVLYGYPNSMMQIYDFSRGDEAYAWVAVDGPGFDARATWEKKQQWCDSPNYVQELSAAHHGLGMFLIVSHADRVIYEKNGNVVYLGLAPDAQ